MKQHIGVRVCEKVECSILKQKGVLNCISQCRMSMKLNEGDKHILLMLLNAHLVFHICRGEFSYQS